MAEQTLLIIEDDQGIVRLLSFNLEREGYKVLIAMDGDVSLESELQRGSALRVILGRAG